MIERYGHALAGDLALHHFKVALQLGNDFWAFPHVDQPITGSAVWRSVSKGLQEATALAGGIFDTVGFFFCGTVSRTTLTPEGTGERVFCGQMIWFQGLWSSPEEPLHKLIVNASVFVFSLFAITVHAQDACRDVLAGGTFSNSITQSNSYVQQIVWSQFMQSSYESSKRDKGFGARIPVGEMVLGANYTEAEYDQRKQQMAKLDLHSFTEAEQASAAVIAGDKEVLRAWSSCMAERRGIVMTLRELNPHTFNIKMEYFPRSTSSTVKLLYDVALTPTSSKPKVTDPFGCLKAGREISMGVPCEATIELKDSMADLQVMVQAADSSASGYVPPRQRLVSKAQEYVIPDKDKPQQVSAVHQVFPVPHTITLSRDLIDEGWTFDPSTAKADLITLYHNHDGACISKVINASSYQFTSSYIASGPSHGGGGRDAAVTCIITPSIMLVRSVWEPR